MVLPCITHPLSSRRELPSTMQDAKNVQYIIADVIHHPITADNDLAGRRIVEFRNDASRFRKTLQPVGGFKDLQNYGVGVGLGVTGDIGANGVEVSDRRFAPDDLHFTKRRFTSS